MPRPGETIYNPRSGQTLKFLNLDSDLLRMECTSPKSGTREPEHIHPYQTNRFALESGTLHFLVNGELRQVGPGREIVIPPRTPHHFWNEFDENAVYIQDFTPALNIASFFEMYFNLAATGKLGANGRPNLLQTLVLTDAYWREIQLTEPPRILQRLLSFALAPIGRLLGYKATLA